MQVVPMKGKIAKVAKAIIATTSLDCKITKGNLVVAKGYYYGNGYSPQHLEDMLTKLFNKYNININTIDSGDVWKAFKGGASIWQQSRFWVELNISTIEGAMLEEITL